MRPSRLQRWRGRDVETIVKPGRWWRLVARLMVVFFIEAMAAAGVNSIAKNMWLWGALFIVLGLAHGHLLRAYISGGNFTNHHEERA